MYLRDLFLGTTRDEHEPSKLIELLSGIRQLALAESGDEENPVIEYVVYLFYYSIKQLDYLKVNVALEDRAERIISYRKAMAACVYSALVFGRTLHSEL